MCQSIGPIFLCSTREPISMLYARNPVILATPGCWTSQVRLLFDPLVAAIIPRPMRLLSAPPHV